MLNKQDKNRIVLLESEIPVTWALLPKDFYEDWGKWSHCHWNILSYPYIWSSICSPQQWAMKEPMSKSSRSRDYSFNHLMLSSDKLKWAWLPIEYVRYWYWKYQRQQKDVVCIVGNLVNEEGGRSLTKYQKTHLNIFCKRVFTGKENWIGIAPGNQDLLCSSCPFWWRGI